MLFKLARKHLNSGVYAFFSQSILGRAGKYDKTFRNFESIFRHYTSMGLDFSGKTVLEVGSGNRFFTPLLFLAAGAGKVMIAEPLFSWERFEKDLENFNRYSGTRLSAAEARPKIVGFKNSNEIPSEWNGRVDIICSHNVLEHFKELPSFFADMARLLSPSGLAYNKVDLSDHTYHIFSKYPFTRWIQRRRMIYHLRYSKPVFHRLNDPKCYMNRFLLPEYLVEARKNGLRIRNLVTEPLPDSDIHEDLLRGLPERKPEELFISGFGLTISR